MRPLWVALVLLGLLGGAQVASATVTCTSIEDATFTDDFPGYICPEGFYPV